MLVSFLVSLLAITSTIAAPSCKLNGRANRPIPQATVTTYLAQKPWWAVYSLSDYSTTQALPQSSQLTGYNVIIAAFWFSTNKPAYKLAEFTSLPLSTRQWILNDYHSRNISFLVSAFGYGDNPTSDNKDPVKVADDLANFVKQYQFDGVDIDWEDFNALAVGANAASGKAEAWLSSFTRELRKQLPQGKYLISHAPVAPWFTMNTTRYPRGAYKAVHAEVGDLIDFYNVQFYNQGSDYTTCPSLLTRSVSGTFHNTSVFEIADPKNAGVDLNKIVIGKPAIPADATNGFLNLTTLSTCLSQAKAKSWKGGAFLWEYHPDSSVPAIKTIRIQSFPV